MSRMIPISHSFAHCHCAARSPRRSNRRFSKPHAACAGSLRRSQRALPPRDGGWFVGRAWRLPSLLLILCICQPVTAATLSRITTFWRFPVPANVQNGLESLSHEEEGAIVTEERLNRIIESALSLLADHGYHHAAVAPQNFRGSDDSLSFDLVIDPGRIATIARWEFAGLVRTDSLWLARALDLPTGIVATAKVIGHGLVRIRAFSILSLVAPPQIVSVDGDSTVTVRLKLREADPAHFEGALAAGSTDGADQSLLGRFSLGLRGLFRRDRSLDLRYEHPQPDERLTRVVYAERLAFSRLISTQLRLEDWRREDHRQQAGLDLSLTPARRDFLTMTVGANWQKIAPLSTPIGPARLYEFSLGMALGDPRNDHLALRGISSINRQWESVTGIENSRARLRIETEGRRSVALPAIISLQIAFGSCWWGRGETLRAGDEWFLGGDILRGYAARSLAATSGLWTRVSVSRSSRSGLGASLFGELAWLSMFGNSARRPGSVGLAILLNSPGRTGRLEIAWRDRASLRDGILRLSVAQGW